MTDMQTNVAVEAPPATEESKSVRKRKAAQREEPASVPAAMPAPATRVMLPPGQLRESPTNKRQHWGDMAELTASVAKVGVLQPPLVRPIADGHELVYGHRRVRAAVAAGLAEIPVDVRELSDLEALEMQVVENVAREDVHPLEEAEYYELLHQNHHVSVDDIAAKVGKSRSYVFGRMKLLALVPEARKAFYEGRLSPSTALYVARVPGALQVEALKELEEQAEEYAIGVPSKDEKPEPLPAREAARVLRDRFMLRLADAPFDRGDAELVPAAGACLSCPKRSGAQPELFGDVPSADVCTDPICFGQKREAAAAKVRAKLEAKGATVVEAKRQQFGVSPPAGYVRPEEFCPEAGKTFGELAKPAKVAKKLDDFGRVVMLDEKNKATPLLKKADVLAAVAVCHADSDPESVAKAWWKLAYGQTYEQSMAER